MPAFASENGLEHYPLGVNTAGPGLLPPPGGFVWLNYNQWYSADNVAGPHGGSVVPGYRLDVYAEAARFICTWPTTWDGVTFSSQIVPQLLGIDLTVPGSHFQRLSLGDLDVAPVILGYNTQTLHVMGDIEAWLPTGYYKATDGASGGLNYYTFAPNVGFTWLPTPQWEASFDAIAQFNTENAKTRYQSGHSFDIDGVLGYRPWAGTPRLQLGLIGNAYQQFTDDAVGGVTVPGGNRGRAFSIGPQLRYDIGHGGMLVKWEHEVGVQNQARGDRVWLQFAYPFSL